MTKLLYGTLVEPIDAISYWELGTLAMRQALSVELRDGMRVLEIGTGPYAILSLWALRRWRIQLIATDIEETWTRWATRTAERNGIQLDVRCADLLTGIDGQFDLVWFVPPFTPSSIFSIQSERFSDDEERLLNERRTRGGEQGWEVIELFLSAVRPALAECGRTMFSVNRAYHHTSILCRIAEGRGLSLVSEHSLSLLPYSTLVFQASSS